MAAPVFLFEMKGHGGNHEATVGYERASMMSPDVLRTKTTRIWYDLIIKLMNILWGGSGAVSMGMHGYDWVRAGIRDVPPRTGSENDSDLVRFDN